MENATKALFIAAGALLAIMVISLMIFLFVIFGSYAKGIHDENDIKALESFNVQFTQYENNRKGRPLTIQDVVTIMNLARENNINNNFVQVNSNMATISLPSTEDEAKKSLYISIEDNVNNPKLTLPLGLPLFSPLENIFKLTSENSYNNMCNKLILQNMTFTDGRIQEFKCRTLKSDTKEGTGRVYKIIIERL